LLEGLDGVEKMSKSKNNYIGISEDANTMFAKVLSDLRHADVALVHAVERSEVEAAIAALKAEVDGGRNPKDAKVACWPRKSPHASTAQRRPKRPNRTSSTAAGAACRTTYPDVALSGAPLGIGALIKQAGLAPSTSRGQPPDRRWRCARGLGRHQ
jgi:tyrosyl-tRNA synthetase